jgi:hypothetical protein
MRKSGAWLIALVTTLLATGSARAATTSGCTAITSLPTTITTSGVYCLTSDMTYNPGSTTGTSAITINVPATNNTNPVVIDLGGYSLRCINGGTYCGGTYGIRYTAGVSGAGGLVRNGRITDFGIGAWLGTAHVTVRDMHFDAISMSGVTGVYIDGSSYDVVIERNVFNCTLPGKTVPATNSYGVNIWYSSGLITISHNAFDHCWYGVKQTGAWYPLVNANTFQSLGYNVTGTGAFLRDNISISAGPFPTGGNFHDFGNNSDF